jgi:hypothetical protein
MEALPKNSAEFNALVKSIKLPEELRAKAISRDFALTADELIAQFCPYWHVARTILRIAKVLTPPKVDAAIDEIIAICDRLCGGATGDEQSALLEKFEQVWPVVKPVLVAVKAITSPKVDAIIDNIVRVGDLLCA